MNFELSDENLKLFKERVNSKHLDGLKWKVLVNDAMKMKNNMCGVTHINKPAIRMATGLDVVFELNEVVFDRLEEKYKIMMIDKLLAYINYNLDTDHIKTCTPDVKEHSGILETYGNLVNALTSEISRIYNEMSEDNTRTDGKEEV